MKKGLFINLLLLGVMLLPLYMVSANSLSVPLTIETLRQQAPHLPEAALQTAVQVFNAAQQRGDVKNMHLAIADMALPSSEKRLWVFDMQSKKLLFHTLVAHGRYSGALYASKFSDKPNTDATSLGVYETGESYIGKHGLSMRLIGLDKGFNDTAYKRDIVMHSASYVNQSFIDKYHRIGRSWGCPAVSPEMIRPLVSTLEKGSILVIYYPDDRWLSESAFLKDK